MDHWQCIEWIERFDFENLPVEDRRTTKNDGERRRTSTESLTETSQKCYRSAPAWIFFLLSLLSLFLSDFQCKGILNEVLSLPPSSICRRKGGGGCCPARPRPGELGCFHLKQSPFSRTSRKGPSGLDCYLHPQFTKYTPFSCFWADFFSKRCETLRITQWYLLSFWNVATLHGLRNDACFPLPECCETLRITQHSLFGLSECCETLRITQQCLLWLPECCETSWITQQCLLWLSKCCETLRIMQQSLFWLSECCETLRITQQSLFWLPERPNKVRKPTANVLGRN